MNEKYAVMAVMGLALLLWSCEKEAVIERGGKVPIIFSMNTSAYDAETKGMRGSVSKKPETEVIALGNDLFMYVTLKEDPIEEQPSGELRAGLFTNQKVRLAAFNKTTGVQEGTAVTYTYNGSKLVPDTGNDPLGVEPDDGTVYRFVAYSYYGDPTTDPEETNISPAKDLVWGVKEQPITDTEAGRTVVINMEHRFPKMRVKLDASAIATEIVSLTNVQLKGKTVDLDIETGDLSANTADAAQTVEDFDGTLNVQTSDYVVFYSMPTKVSIQSMVLKIGGVNKTFTPPTTNFNKVWEGGKSYTLEVDVKKLVWAGSNIYWDDVEQEMRFSETTVINYQGIFFPWGSLVGFSPTGEITTLPMTMLIYIPNVDDGTWQNPRAVANQAERMYDPPIAADELSPDTENYLYDRLRLDVLGGDICSYLTGGVWRMPSGAEYAASLPYSWSSGSVSANASGTGIINAGYTSSVTSVFLPASGMRHGTNLYPAGTQSQSFQCYWSGSSGKAESGRRLRPDNNVVESANFRFQLPVRCVKH
jgi:hypothetical protein